MPELPEIETLRRQCQQRLVGKSFISIVARRADLRRPIPKDFSAIINAPVMRVDRRSKYLLLIFANDTVLVIHLGMSGRLFFSAAQKPYDKHDHVIFFLSPSEQLRFRDPRRFGLIDLVKMPDLKDHALFRGLGLEPLEKTFNSAALSKICHRSSAPIKTTLMNAKHIVGVGNIYANEALFASGIKPQRRSHLVTHKESASLCRNIKRILQASITQGGTSFKDFVGITEEPGLHSVKLKIYGREGEKCRRCEGTIKKITLAGRGTYYCPGCQW